MKVWPSGLAVAQASMPITPDAPLRLSTTTGTFQRWDSCGPSNRAQVSAVVPGVNGTMMRIGRDGYSCAGDSAGNIATHSSSPAIAIRPVFMVVGIPSHVTRHSSLVTELYGDVRHAFAVLHRVQRALLEIR